MSLTAIPTTLPVINTWKKARALHYRVHSRTTECRCPCSPALSIECLIKCISRLCGHFDEEVTENDCRVIGLDVTCAVSKPLPATFAVCRAVCVLVL